MVRLVFTGSRHNFLYQLNCLHSEIDNRKHNLGIAIVQLTDNKGMNQGFHRLVGYEIVYRGDASKVNVGRSTGHSNVAPHVKMLVHRMSQVASNVRQSNIHIPDSDRAAL